MSKPTPTVEDLRKQLQVLESRIRFLESITRPLPDAVAQPRCGLKK